MIRTITVARSSLLLLFLLLSLTGCWDSKPIDHQGIVLMMSIRSAKTPGQYDWRFVFPNVTLSPSSLSSIAPSEEYYDIRVTAPNFAVAVMLAQQKSARSLYLGQLEGIVWDTHLPFSHLWPLFSAINGAGTIPKTFWVMTADGGSLSQYMNFVSPQVVAPRIALAAYFDCSRCSPVQLGERGWKFWSDAVSPGISPYAPVVQLKQNSLAVREVAVYAPSGHAVVYTPAETQGLGYLTGRVQRLTLTFPWHGQMVSLARVSDSRSVKTWDTPQALDVRETIHLTAFIDEVSGQNVVTRSDEREIARRAEQNVLDLCLLAIQRANATHTDPFGYGRSSAWFHPIPGFHPIAATVTVIVKLKGEGVIR